MPTPEQKRSLVQFTHHLNKARVPGALILSCLLSGGLRAEDWPQWRGPNRDSVWAETGILESFPAKGLKLDWHAPVGPGWSSPVVAQGRVYLTDAHLMSPVAKERILCFEERTGKPLWTFANEVNYPTWAFTPRQEAGPASTPIVEAGRVYNLGGNGHVHCLDVRKGEMLWEKRLDKEYKVEILACRPSPLIDGNLLILLIGGKPGACVVALDKATGKEVWKALDESVSNSSPIVIVAGGKRQLIVWTGESVTSLDPVTGKTWWRERLVTSNNDAIPTPVFHKDLLLIGGLMMKLDSIKPAASILWPDTRAASRRILSNTSTGLIKGDYVYSAKSSGSLVCLDARNGKQIWETDKVTDLKRGASINLTPNGDSELLYTDRGELIRARLTPQGYQEIARARLLQPVYPFAGRNLAWSPASYANQHVFARTEKELVCASLAKP